MHKELEKEFPSGEVLMQQVSDLSIFDAADNVSDIFHIAIYFVHLLSHKNNVKKR